MSDSYLQVIAPCVYVRDGQGRQVGPFYAGGIIPGGLDEAHLDTLVADGMLAEVEIDEEATEVSDPDTNSKADDILAFVGDDTERAQTFLDAENAKESPRKTLVSKLEAVVAANAGGGAS